LQVPVHNSDGQVVDQIELDETVFGVPPNEVVVHQALTRQLANSRAGTAGTKTRSEVSGSTRKLFRQKHTGFARAGSRRSPIRRGGGVAFGPRLRSYRQAMPKKMRRLALRCVLSAKVSEDELVVIDSIELGQPKTRQARELLERLGIRSSVLLVTAEPDMNLVKSARNISGARTLPASMINVGDLLSHKRLLMTVDAARRVEAIWGKKSAVTETQVG
jgi:large subunit ribosomal protein L4